ncbi:MAG: DnaA regulatory inactivator Hda [Burkholderiaceae bacterium]|nr:DnaA regulatory inactivator Hda [Burkholderiaceae bacterium]
MPHHQLPLPLLTPPAQTLDNFVPGRNGEALAAARELAAGSGPQFVYFWGPPGSGRTHLLTALSNACAQPGGSVGAVRLHTADDVHALDEPGQARLFQLLDTVRSDSAARLVAAGDRPPARLPLREDVRSRLGWGLALALHPLSEEEKADALRAQLTARGVRAAADLIDYMLSHMPRDMRTLSAVLNALDSYALQHGRALTVPLLRAWLLEQAGKMSPE